MTDARYLTSLEALLEGLLKRDEPALAATIVLMQSAHQRWRTRIVLAIADLPSHLRIWALDQWFDGPWFVERAAWWILAYLERTHDEGLSELVPRYRLFDRLTDLEDGAVQVQALGWLLARARAGRVPEVAHETPLARSLVRWLDTDDEALAVATLQCLVVLGVDVPTEDVNRAIDLGVKAKLREADFLGLHFGREDCALRLVEEIRRVGPWSAHAVDALSAYVVPSALDALAPLLHARFRSDDVRIHAATVLAAHGSPEALEALVRFSKSKNPRRSAMGFSARVKALERRGSDAAHVALWKEVLSAPEATRAWVLSCLSPGHPFQRMWLDQAREYGTDEERLAVEDAMRAFLPVDGALALL